MSILLNKKAKKPENPVVESNKSTVVEKPPSKSSTGATGSKGKPKRKRAPKLKPIPIEFRSIINRLSNHYFTTWFKNVAPTKRGKMLEAYEEINELRKHVKLEGLK